MKPTAHKAVGPGGSRMTTGGKGVALTFDDGPDPAQTPKILKLLAQNHTHATFCLVGENVQRHPEMVRKIVAGGHTLCNHTWNHDLKLGKKTAAQIKADMARTNAAIRKAVPNAQIKYFRAPGGNFTPGVVAVAKQLGMTSLYWRVDPRDWDHPKGETDAQHRARVIARVKKNTHAGSIVLSHDYAQPDTIDAYRTLLPWLRKRYQLVGL
jgi:peptidoglycan/xylan/chitin deacetylase (PgdA/CDA1 family)